jgi:nitrilase
MVRIAALQMASAANVQANLLEAERLVMKAAQAGAKLAVLPENFAFMGIKDRDKLLIAEIEGQGPIQEALSRMAQRAHIWLVAGTIPLKSPEPERVYASCLLFDDKGQKVARFDKIHLFDVHIADSNETYRESATILPGDQAVVVEGTPVGRLGLAVCYDLRFPELFRELSARGAQVVALPAAFTQMTGRAHWEVLLRARAIENLTYVVAAAQGGYHANGRETYGDSMIVDAWGNILERRARGSGMALAEVDLEQVKHLRTTFPVLKHRRL